MVKTIQNWIIIDDIGLCHPKMDNCVLIVFIHTWILTIYLLIASWGAGSCNYFKTDMHNFPVRISIPTSVKYPLMTVEYYLGESISLCSYILSGTWLYLYSTIVITMPCTMLEDKLT